MKVDNSAQIRNRIEELKRGKHAVILAHYYTLPEVQEVADFLGDSLALSVSARCGQPPVTNLQREESVLYWAYYE